MRHVAVVLFCVGLAAVAAAQDPAPTEFEVSSVKPAAPDRPFGDIVRRSPPGQWKLFGVTLRNAIVIAYPEFHLPGLLVGGPEWLNERRFDLQGRMHPTTTHTELQLMIRRLLADRFGLRTHIEQRALDVYALTLKTPGTFGPGLTRASTACVVWRMAGGTVPGECDLYRRRGGEGAFTMAAATIPDFITAMTMTAVYGPSVLTVSSAIDRPVVDKTGLEGYFQIIGPSPNGAPANGSFFTLLEEQLGLKLTRAREVMDVLVIDSVRLPDPD